MRPTPSRAWCGCRSRRRICRSFLFPFEVLLEVRERAQPPALEFSDPPFGDLVYGNGIDVVQLLPAAPLHGDQVRLFEENEMLGHCLARHVELLRKIVQRLSVPRM